MRRRQPRKDEAGRAFHVEGTAGAKTLRLGVYLAHARNNEEASVAGLEGARREGRRREDQIGQVGRS